MNYLIVFVNIYLLLLCARHQYYRDMNICIFIAFSHYYFFKSQKYSKVLSTCNKSCDFYIIMGTFRNCYSSSELTFALSKGTMELHLS